MSNIDKNAIETITPRQLRKILFHIDNEDMTVKELRKRLFDIDNQDAPVNVDFALSANLGLSK